MFRCAGEGPDGEQRGIQLLDRHAARLFEHGTEVPSLKELANLEELQALIARFRDGPVEQSERRIKTANPVEEVGDKGDDLRIRGDIFGRLFKESPGLFVITGHLLRGCLQDRQQPFLRGQFVLLRGGIGQKFVTGPACLPHLRQDKEVVFQLRGRDGCDLLCIGQKLIGRFVGPFHEREQQQMVFAILRRQVDGVGGEFQSLIELSFPGLGEGFCAKCRYVLDRQQFLEWGSSCGCRKDFVGKRQRFFCKSHGRVQLEERVLGVGMIGVQFKDSGKDSHGLL